MASIRVPLFRSESSGAVAGGSNNQIFQLSYNMAAAGRLTPGSNTQALESAYPIAIYSYSIELIHNFYGALYQTFGNVTDLAELSAYDFTEPIFVAGLKQCRLINGAVGAAGTVASFGRTKISYRAKKNARKHRDRFGKWRKPPIFLGPDSGDLFNISVKNVSADTGTMLALMEIHSWKQFT